ncbi:MAG: 1-deoxy-D-xylulose-5-phosphate synthase [Gammaproteobacteria bacterium]|nr:1-deoxy-D-xylulose-5-phosphate synthase [Gammaproteobacteria bacterium]
MIQKIPKQLPATPLFDQVGGVVDLRCLKPAQLPQLAYELRLSLLYSVGQTGGHLGAGLGVVELTIALHYLLNTPNDKLIWDVGHQSYPHKMLTGRKEAMLTMRQVGGLAPFPKRSESVFDAFGVGHASTSISALLGMVLASANAGSHAHHVAVIGDGALTGGMAFEALNHMAHCQANALIIVNDNDMAIDENLGGLATFLDDQHGHGGPDQWFTALGFTYRGPIDGHDLPVLLQTIKQLLAISGPKLLHIHTLKGKGYGPAELDPVGYHALGKIDPVNALTPKKRPTYAQVFGKWACSQAAADERLMAITPAMAGGSGLEFFAKQFTSRFFDVAIAEQHALTLAAGMACEGAKPVIAIYSTFLQRGYDQLIHDIALQELDILLAIDRAGVVGEDGATHTGAYDLAFLRCLPNMVVMTPSSATEAQAMLEFGFSYNGPASVRYPRGEAFSGLPSQGLIPCQIEMGRGNLLHEAHHDKAVALLNFGALLAQTAQVAEDLGATLVDMRFVKPIDETLLEQLLATHIGFVTIEDHSRIGGAGSAVGEWLVQQKTNVRLLSLGHYDEALPHGSRDEVLQYTGLSGANMHHTIAAWIEELLAE